MPSRPPEPAPGDDGREILDNPPRWWSLSLLGRVPRWVMLTLAAALLAGGGAVLAAGHTSAHTGSPGPATPVAAGGMLSGPAGGDLFLPPGCRQSARQRPAGDRVVLGDVAVPPAYVGPVQPNGNGQWRYWTKSAFGVRGGSPVVTISVPASWRSVAAVDREVDGTGSAFQILTCPPANTWNFSVGGFYLKAPTACVPLDISVGRRATTVWFGLGRPCPARPGTAVPSGAAGGS